MSISTADQWISDYLEGSIQAEAFRSFKQWLSESPEHADHFMHQAILLQHLRTRFETHDYEEPETFMELMAQLEKGGSEPVLVDITESVLLREKEERSRNKNRQTQSSKVNSPREYVIPKPLVWMALAAVLGLALWFGPFWGTGSAPINEVAIEAPLAQESSAVAFVTSELNAIWGQGGLDQGGQGQGRALVPDQAVYLEKGMARVIFASGAEVTLQGPVRFKATGRNAAEISLGRLVADVPPQAMGFKVQTPEGLVTDYGTEFGVAVDEAGLVDTHVFTGEVTFSSRDSEDLVELRAGDAVRANSAGVKTIQVDPRAFVRRDDFKTLVTTQQDAYKRWLAYSQELRGDTALVAYYTFSTEDEQAGLLRNVAEATADGLHGQWAGNTPSSPTWDAGRFPQKRGLRFDRTKPQWVRVPNDSRLNPGKAITIACWINRTGERDHSGIFLSKIDSPTAGFSYQLGGFDSNALGHELSMQFATSVVELGARESSPVFDADSDQWEHVAVTYDGSTVRFYHNGLPAGSEPMTLPMSASRSDLFIGRDAVHAETHRNPFGGVMDEMVILSRAMSVGEITQMYEHGIPVGMQTD